METPLSGKAICAPTCVPLSTLRRLCEIVLSPVPFIGALERLLASAEGHIISDLVGEDGLDSAGDFAGDLGHHRPINFLLN